MDFEGIGRVATNTTLAACAGGLVAMAWVYPKLRKWDVGITVNGFLEGSSRSPVPATGSIRCPPSSSAVWPASWCGLGINFIEWLRIDDPIGAVAVHGIAGIWGTISLGLFAAGKYGLAGPTGPIARRPTACPARSRLIWGGGTDQLIAQVKGSAVITVCALGVGLALMYLVKAHGHLASVGGGRARGPRHPRARRPRLPHGVRHGHQLHHHRKGTGGPRSRLRRPRRRSRPAA